MKKFSIMLCALLLTSCGSVLPKGQAPATLYTLNAPVSSPTAEPQKIPASLQILMPQAVPGLETEKIALRKGYNQIDYYSDIRWAGAVHAVVQSLLVQSFDESGQLSAVSNDLVAVKEQYSLLVEIRDFQAEYAGGAPGAHIQLIAKLIKTDNNEIIATSVYDETEAAKADNAQEIVAAFDRAYQRASGALVAETLQILSRQYHVPVAPLKDKKAASKG